MNLEIKKEDAQKILDYLVQRPFVEVNELVSILVNLKSIDEGEEKC